jgi:hypothetical protein
VAPGDQERDAGARDVDEPDPGFALRR